MAENELYIPESDIGNVLSTFVKYLLQKKYPNVLDIVISYNNKKKNIMYFYSAKDVQLYNQSKQDIYTPFDEQQIKYSN